jgi:predicted lipid-binding transport protein (Tim44 family)
MTSLKRSKLLQGLAIVMLVLTCWAGAADARAGRGGAGFGSRGSRTFSMPPPTQTAPGTAGTMGRSWSQPGTSAAATGMAGAGAGRGMFGRGFGGGLLGGLLGAGLFGMLFGYGFMGGMGGIGSIFGFLLQIGLIVIVARLGWAWLQRRQQPAYAGSRPSYRTMPGMDDIRPAAAAGGAAGARAADEIGIGQTDLDAFERLLGVIQMAYGQDDRATIRAHATAEVARELEQELDQNRARGIAERISDVRLLQGDLAESWREAGTDYATVAMRFSLVEVQEDAGGRMVGGDPARPVEAVELWTFRREQGGDWQLSAIQQG